MPVTNQSFTYFSYENSTLIPLDANAHFTGSWEDVSQFATIYTLWRTNVDGTLFYEFSIDGIVVDCKVDCKFPVSTFDLVDGNFASSGVRARYFRVSYINGTDAQYLFRLQTTYSLNGLDAGHTPIGSGLTTQTNSSATRSAIHGITSDGSFIPVKLNSDGTIITSSINQITLIPNLQTNKLITSDTSPDQVILNYSPNKTLYLSGFSVYVWDTMTSYSCVFGEASLESPEGNKLYTAQLTSIGLGKIEINFGQTLTFPANQTIRLVCSPSEPITNQTWQGNLIGAMSP